MNVATEQTWPERRLRFLTRRGLSDEQREVLASATQTTFLPMESIGEQGELDCSALREVDDVENGYTRFFDGDVLVAKITPCFENGKGALVRGTLNGVGFGTTELHVLSPGSEIDARFLYYVTATDQFRRHGEAAMYGAAGQKRVPEDFVRDYRVPVPPLAWQRAIAEYLDREMARLAALVAAKQRLLDLLAEKRQAIIAHAVTRGLDPDAPKCDSDLLRWTEVLPDGWEMKPLRAVVHYVVSNVDKVASDDEIPVRLCNYMDVYNNEFIRSDLEFMRATASRQEISRFGLSADDVIITKDSESWEDIGVPALVAETSDDLVCGYHLALLRPHKDTMRGKYLFRCLQAKPIRIQLELGANGVTRFGLPKSEISKMILPVPPLSIQYTIADHLDRETARLDALMARVRQAIELVEERRAALIAAAVTGQLDVGSAS